ncbi:TIR domain-containing protein [Micromonospora sp. DT81.3]|uniref:TIR domain-containing protein n=1 Tax=Micromonospora sp. DT81.3 TaxID=3416523 RepID=UPI003CFAD59C
MFTVTLFLSYSSTDGDAVRSLVDNIEASGRSVWLDQNLVGGEAWWGAVLREIRGCTVFLFALSPNSLASDPCAAEFEYARALGLPILPVEIVDIPPEERRNYAVYSEQIVDYRQRSASSAMLLIRALPEREAERRPLPDPLPSEPQMPYAYLLTLGSVIRGRAPIAYSDQQAILAQLRAALRHERSESVRSSIRSLLRSLRDRPDATHTTVVEIDSFLQPATTPNAPHAVDSVTPSPVLPSERRITPESDRKRPMEAELAPDPRPESIPLAAASARPSTEPESTPQKPSAPDDGASPTPAPSAIPAVPRDPRSATNVDALRTASLRRTRVALFAIGGIALVSALIRLLAPAPTAAAIIGVIAFFWIATGLVFLALGLVNKAFKGGARTACALLGIVFIVVGALTYFFAIGSGLSTYGTVDLVFPPLGVSWVLAGIVALFALRESLILLWPWSIGLSWAVGGAVLVASAPLMRTLYAWALVLAFAQLLVGGMHLSAAFMSKPKASSTPTDPAKASLSEPADQP